MPTTESGHGRAAPSAGFIRDHFDGDVALFFAFRARCVTQFTNDIAQGDAAVQTADLAALRRLAHNLRSVLLTLDEAAAADCATRLEARLLAGDAPDAVALWAVLRSELQALHCRP